MTLKNTRNHRCCRLFLPNSSNQSAASARRNSRTKLRRRSFANIVAVFKHVRHAQKRVRDLLGVCLVAHWKGGARIVFTNKRSPAHNWRESPAFGHDGKISLHDESLLSLRAELYARPKRVFLCVGTSSACVANRVRGAREPTSRHDDSRLLRYDASSRTECHHAGKSFCCCDSGSAKVCGTAGRGRDYSVRVTHCWI